MKRLVEGSLKADVRFSDIKIETRWTGTYDPKAWRKPDVQAVYDNLRIAFEMQASATYIHVMRGRRSFYLRNGGLLFWVFPELNPDLRRLYQEDVFFNNNSNLFAVDAETFEHSIRTGKLTLRCHYCIPHLKEGEIVDEWQDKLVSIDEIRIERHKQEAYCFDYRTARINIQEQKTKEDADTIRTALEQFWETHGAGLTSEGKINYVPVRDALRAFGLSVPDSYYELPFFALVPLLFSAKYGRPFVLKYPKLVSVAHWAFDHYKSLLLPFGWIAKMHGTDAVLREQDTSGKWQARREIIRQKLRERDPAFAPDTQYAALIDFLFPGVGVRLRQMREKWDADETENSTTN